MGKSPHLSNLLTNQHQYRIQQEIYIARDLQKQNPNMTRDQALLKAAAVFDKGIINPGPIGAIHAKGQ